MSTYFSGGKIWSRLGESISSLRISDGVIVEIDGDSLPGDEIIDLADHFLAPAFMDGHAHPLFAGRESQGPGITGLKSVAEIVDEVRRFADAHPAMPWIVGGAYEAALVEQGDFLASWIDEAVADRPVALEAVDHHTIWVNTKALEIAGISATTTDPLGGSIIRNDDGSPRGTLREPAAMDLVMRHSPANTLEDDVAAIAWACERYLENGVTGACDAWVEPGMAEAYIEAARRGLISIGFNLCLIAQPRSWREQSEYVKKVRKEIDSLGSQSKLTVNAIKFVCDGALSSGSAALLEPYLDVPQSSGLLMWSDAEFTEAATHFDSQGYQLHIHAIGDAAVRQALNIIEIVKLTNPERDRRPVIVHAQLISEDDLPRFKTLDVIANFQPLWTYLDPMNKELIAPRIGEARNNRQYQLASMAKSGARISYGSDWPVTSNIPLEALGVPTHRESPDGFPTGGWSPQEAISVEESLSFYTEGVAYQNFKENRLGRIDIGFDADLVILSANPLDLDPRQISSVKVIATYKAGRRYGYN